MAGRPATQARRARSVRVVTGALVAVLAAGVAGTRLVGRSSTAATGQRSGSSQPPSASVPPGGTAPGGAALPAGQTVVTGTAAQVQAGGATGPSLDTPLEITVPVRGRGGATIYGVTVGGSPSTIVWSGGEPLGLIGHGAVVPGRVAVTVDSGGATWQLDGAERIVVPGYYEAAAPVAVGQAGLAQPEDSATFTAGPHAVLTTSGGATVHRLPGPLHLVGPGSLSLTGTLHLVTRAGAADVRSLHLASGSYEIDLTPTPNGLTVRATLQGAVTTTPPTSVTSAGG